MKIIFDLGSNNGDDVEYYLKKADKVVAVEANPELAAQIGRRFPEEITAGRLAVENCVLTVDRGTNDVPFFLHKSDHVLSQLPRPETPSDYDVVLLPSVNIIDLINRHGQPFYVKIDLENYDQEILRHLFDMDIRPPFISAESHSIEVFSLLVALGFYKSFNLVNGATVASKYKECAIQTADGKETYSFPHHSAGPFGEDIDGPWLTAENLIRLLAFEGLGWRDIHATTVIAPDPFYIPPPTTNFWKREAARLIAGRVSHGTLRAIRKLISPTERPR